MTEKVFKSPYPIKIPTGYYQPVQLVSNFPKKDIFKTGYNSNGTTTTLYTVPKGKVFVLEYFYLWYASISSVPHPRADHLLYASNDILMFIQSAGGDPAFYRNNNGLSISLPRGLRFTEGTIFKIDSGTDSVTLSSGIYGYETEPENVKY